MATLILLAAMFVLLWALLIRPQRRKQMEQQQLLASIEPGDEVLTVGGIYGIVTEVDDEDDLIVEIAEGIQVRVARRAVGGVVKPDEEGSEDDDHEEDAAEPAVREDDVVDSEDDLEGGQREQGDQGLGIENPLHGRRVARPEVGCTVAGLNDGGGLGTRPSPCASDPSPDSSSASER